MRLTPQQVETALKAHRAQAEEALKAYRSPPGPLEDSLDEWLQEVSHNSFADSLRFTGGPVELPGVGGAYFVAYERTYDRHGDALAMVFRLGEQLFQINGSASSYDGDFWDNEVTEVVAREKTITVYEEVNHGK